MKKIRLELTEEELHHLAEMTAFALSLMGIAKQHLKNPAVDEWQKLGAKLLQEAHSVPAIGKDMEHHPELGHWFFTASYVDRAFYSELLDEVRDALFWSELVTNMATNTLERLTPPQELESLSDDERLARLAALESALWKEVTRHGIDRLIFLLQDEES